MTKWPGTFVVITVVLWLLAHAVGYFCHEFAHTFSYVPLRVFASHADMHTVALGFGWTPLEVLLYVGIPFFAAVIWFFARLQPATLAWLFPRRIGYRYAVIVLTSLTVFGFFCLGGLSGYGEGARQLSIAFMAIGGPLSLIISVLSSRRSV